MMSHICISWQKLHSVISKDSQSVGLIPVQPDFNMEQNVRAGARYMNISVLCWRNSFSKPSGKAAQVKTQKPTRERHSRLADTVVQQSQQVCQVGTLPGTTTKSIPADVCWIFEGIAAEQRSTSDTRTEEEKVDATYDGGNRLGAQHRRKTLPQQCSAQLCIEVSTIGAATSGRQHSRSATDYVQDAKPLPLSFSSTTLLSVPLTVNPQPGSPAKPKLKTYFWLNQNQAEPK